MISEYVLNIRQKYPTCKLVLSIRAQGINIFNPNSVHFSKFYTDDLNCKF